MYTELEKQVQDMKRLFVEKDEEIKRLNDLFCEKLDELDEVVPKIIHDDKAILLNHNMM
ncbi:9460_t:CDS:2 [Racocetra fulgida]|uniref:9460_t:CDS:1 n=1 Tax=Racocetra fulgida TaxID=60492 RepID=A0A9N9DQU2_9GLOM|nr:9460_t:CDS:2 [Racocetra fulgida]